MPSSAQTGDHKAHKNFRANLQLIATLLDENIHNAVRMIERNDPSASELLRFLRRQNLDFFFGSHLAHPSLHACIPPKDRVRLEAYVHRQRERQRKLVAELSRLRSIFEARSIPFILLKGPFIALRFFEGIHKRAYGDLDILVARADLSRAQQVLREAGYSRRSRVLLGDLLTTQFTHGYDYIRPGIPIDLHWSLGAHISYRIEEESLWKTRQNFSIDGQQYDVLSDEYVLLNLLLSFFEDLDRGAGRIRSVADIYTVLRKLHKRIDWPAFFARRSRENVADICTTILSITLELLECQAHFPQLAQALADRTHFTSNHSQNLESLIEGPHGNMRNKIWASGIYSCSRAACLGWWVISLPFRMTVHHRGTLSHFLRSHNPPKD